MFLVLIQKSKLISGLAYKGGICEQYMGTYVCVCARTRASLGGSVHSRFSLLESHRRSHASEPLSLPICSQP